ncbi:siroheme synthase/precorrin-2 oxidase [Cenarchaeum symbiosum A]|uniref:precorrin-2 dehydrogenase n=1 Tax=Cenarchaeum symbiosum (strain A) TaxID=414004 RepID=A0RXF9_CENSY|nr:siroheme synthase/precorrin-2 oxidase [Cenarchaeum symbiosum A]
MIVDLHLKGGLVIVVGAGAEGQKKVKSLLTQDCKILVVSREFGPRMEEYALDGRVRLQQSSLEDAGFLSGYAPRVVMATTDDRDLNREIVSKARAAGCLAYASDDPESSDFAHPSVINIEDTVQVAVSTGGRSPAMARKIRQEAERIFRSTIKREDILQIRLQDSMRGEAKKRIGSQEGRKKYMYSIINDDRIMQLIRDDRLDMARERAAVMLDGWR